MACWRNSLFPGLAIRKKGLSTNSSLRDVLGCQHCAMANFHMEKCSRRRFSVTKGSKSKKQWVFKVLLASRADSAVGSFPRDVFSVWLQHLSEVGPSRQTLGVRRRLHLWKVGEKLGGSSAERTLREKHWREDRLGPNLHQQCLSEKGSFVGSTPQRGQSCRGC